MGLVGILGLEIWGRWFLLCFIFGSMWIPDNWKEARLSEDEELT